MLEMLKARKAALEAQGKKGFTLMEMLIVIAIIAVLIAIAIPAFTAQLDKANQATTAANLRSAYAEASAQHMLDNKNPVVINGVNCPSKSIGDQTLPFTRPTITTPGENNISFSWNDKGEVTASVATGSGEDADSTNP